ncbi:juvenile hormone esterase [Plutella xylostella]|uniref:juvenile hormone esterase n=1 Tax=Plutella xylostella TaxID=51655 RepID=UPI00203296F5|nr:juvenile hormone esterase [Plutella xylostella]
MARSFASLAAVAIVLAGVTSSLAAARSFSDSCGDVAARTDAGLVCGRRRAHQYSLYASFRGIPYAKPPLNELRFQAPQPVEPWKDYLNATVEGPICPQQTIFYGPLMEPRGMDEDCLTINVHTPMDAFIEVQDAAPPEVDLVPPYRAGEVRRNFTGVPIVVWIHGGGFGFGSGDSDVYGPEYLVAKGVMVVTFNYRLGALGFLSLNTSAVPGNAGLRDMLAALRWVRRNGARFGGDVSQVTLAGHSAGAAAAHLLTLAPATQGMELFHKAVLMSGAAARGFVASSPVYAAFAAETFLQMLGVNGSDPEQARRELQAAPAERLHDVAALLQDLFGLSVFYPVVEAPHAGVEPVLDDDPEALVSKGRGSDIPLMIGFTENEWESFRPRFVEISIVDILQMKEEVLLPPGVLYKSDPKDLKSKLDLVKARYFPNNETTLDEFGQLLTESYFQYPALFTAQRRLALGGAPAFLYQFSYRGEHRAIENQGFQYGGAVHLEDVLYVFKVNSKAQIPDEKLQDSTDSKMQHWMTMLFTDFMRTGSPVGADRSADAWPPVRAGDFRYQDIRAPELRMLNLTAAQREMVQFYENLYSNS